MSAIGAFLAGRVRHPILPIASPVRRLLRLEAALASSSAIWIKRDDALLPFCGNKLRYLEFVLGAVRAEGADAIVHCGGSASNYLPQLAIVGATSAISIHVAIQAGPEAARDPCPLLVLLHGGEVRFIGSASCATVKAEWAEQLKAEGRRPFVIGAPFANHSAILGFLAAAAELDAQTDAGAAPHPRRIYMCSAGNSYLGLRLGAALLGDPWEVRAFSPVRFADTHLSTIAFGRGEFLRRKLQDFSAFVGRDLPQFHPVVDESMVGTGYPVPTREGMEAVRLVARTEGIALDPIYTGKAMAGMIADIRAGRVARGEDILFWHSGGAANIFRFPELARP
jgi:D-cysteine desulfhydrase/L-cysteate sulfo-lyase